MSGLTDREKAFEEKFAHDEALKFKAEARRNKLLGIWVAGLIGKDDAEAYAREVIEADLSEAGDEDLFRKLRGDLDAAGVSVSDTELRTRMVDFLGEAIDQLSAN